MSNRASGQPANLHDFDPEVLVESFGPVLRKEIEQATALMPRISRQSTYQSIPVAGQGSPVPLLGFDATRQAFAIAASADTVYMGNDASIQDSGSLSAASPSVPVPTYPQYFEFQHQAPVYVWNSGAAGTVAFVYVIVMAHGIA